MSRNGQLNASKFFRYHSFQHFFLGNNLTQQPKKKRKKSIRVRILNQPKTENLLKVLKIVKKNKCAKLFKHGKQKFRESVTFAIISRRGPVFAI